jgi:hypothetical protein
MWAGRQQTKTNKRQGLGVKGGISLLLAALLCLLLPVNASAAINQIPIPGSKSSSFGLEATKKQPPPDTPPSITTPGGGSFGTSPITVSGICKDGLLVEVYDNGVFVGSVMCKGGSFSIQVSLFSGQNEITAIQYDDLGQASPISNTVIVTYNTASTVAFGQLITLTSTYSRRAVNPSTSLTWPLQISGGNGPYALSIDWGDGSSPQLKSQALAGVFNIDHIYKQPGIYKVTIKVVDANGVSAFLQVVAVVNGTPPASAQQDNGSGGTKTVTKVMWLPAVVSFVLLAPTYWLGRRSQLVSLHRKLEHDMENYKEL